MAKQKATKSTNKPAQAAAKPMKAKGPKPDYKPRPKVKVDVVEAIKTQPILYYGENHATGLVVLSEKGRSYSETKSRQFAWSVVEETVKNFTEEGRVQLSLLATRASKAIEDGGPSTSAGLNDLEFRSLGFIATGGVFTKRIRFWAFMVKYLKNEIPEGLANGMNLPHGRSAIALAEHLKTATFVLSEKAKELIAKGGKLDEKYLVKSTTGSAGNEFWTPQEIIVVPYDETALAQGANVVVKLKAIVR